MVVAPRYHKKREKLWPRLASNSSFAAPASNVGLILDSGVQPAAAEDETAIDWKKIDEGAHSRRGR